MSSEQEAEQALRAAARSYIADEWRAALDSVSRALEADPRSYKALILAGDMYSLCGPELGVDEREGELRAISFFDRAIAAQPHHAEAYAHKAETLVYLGEYAAAIECADQAANMLDAH